MNENKYLELINKIDIILRRKDGSIPSVSPITTALGGKTPKAIIISDIVSGIIKLESLSSDELILVHAQLHRFYPRGIDNVTKQDLEKLHKQLKTRIKHTTEFDMLDKDV